MDCLVVIVPRGGPFHLAVTVRGTSKKRGYPAVEDIVLHEKHGPIGMVTLNYGRAYNTLTLEMMEALEATLKDIASRREVAVVILQGNEKTFSSGHNLREIQGLDLQGVYDLFQRSFQLKRTIREMPQVVIAKVRGLAVAAGLELVAVSDLAVAAESARFGTTGINWGLFCSTPAVFLSRNVGRKKAAEMLFTGNLYSAREAEAMGLVNRVVPDDALDEATEALAREIAKQSLDVIALGKRMFYQQLQMHDFEALAYATEVIVRNSKHPDAVSGIQAFCEKRKPVWHDGLQRDDADVTASASTPARGA